MFTLSVSDLLRDLPSEILLARPLSALVPSDRASCTPPLETASSGTEINFDVQVWVFPPYLRDFLYRRLVVMVPISSEV